MLINKLIFRNILNKMGATHRQLLMKENILTLGSTKTKDAEENDILKKEEIKEEEDITIPKIDIYESASLSDVPFMKNGDMKKSKDIMIIPLPLNKDQEQSHSNLGITSDNQIQNPDYEGYPYNAGEHSTAKKSEEEKYGDIEEAKEEILYKKFGLKNKRANSKTKKNNNSISFIDTKKEEAKINLSKKDLKEKVEHNDQRLLLEPKYEKGIQVILRRLDCGSMKGRFLLWNNIGHIFIRYYNKSKGIDKVIESVRNHRINEIRFYDFKKEVFIKRFKYYKIIMDEGLSIGEKFENIKNILIKKYIDKNGIINRGKYSVLKNCCYDTVEEALILFKKSPEAVKRLHSEFFLPTFKSIRKIVWK